MKSNFLHIGYHKTGTSWMQKFLFPEVFEDKYSGKPFEDDNNNDWSFLEHTHKKQNTAISNEWVMRQNSSTEELSSILDDKLTNTKILISIRRQQELLFSRFLHMPIERFKLWDVDLSACLFKPSSFIKSRQYISLPLYWYYNFAETYRNFVSRFGKQNVHFIIYENLFTETENEIERLERFLDKDISEPQKKLIKENTKKHENRTKDHPKSPTAKRWEKEPKEFKEKTFSIIQSGYEESNEQMSSLINFDLSKYGYCK